MLDNIFSGDLKCPVTSMTTDYVRSILKYHLSFFTTENGSFGCGASEKSRVEVFVCL